MGSGNRVGSLNWLAFSFARSLSAWLVAGLEYRVVRTVQLGVSKPIPFLTGSVVHCLEPGEDQDS